MIGAFILIIIGIIFLGINFGFIDSTIWSTIWQYWPVILILVGISILCKSVLPKVAANVITIIALISAFGCIVLFNTLDYSGSTNNTATAVLNIDEPLSSTVTKLETEVTLGAQDLLIEDLSSGMVDGRIESPNGSSATYTLEEVDGIAKLVVDQKSGIKFWPTQKVIGTSRLALTNQVPVKLVLNVGAVDINADFSKLKMEKFELDSGAMTADIKLGDLLDKSEIDIDTGASDVSIKVPLSVGLKVVKSSGVSSINFNNLETETSGDTVTTKNYTTATKTINVDLSCGASTINFIGY